MVAVYRVLHMPVVSYSIIIDFRKWAIVSLLRGYWRSMVTQKPRKGISLETFILEPPNDLNH